MEIPDHRRWMYNRLLPNRGGYVDEFLDGLIEFIDIACQQPKYLSEKVIRCPCLICKNEQHHKPDVVHVHILRKGFTPRYWYWTSHGEEAPQYWKSEYVKAKSEQNKKNRNSNASASLHTGGCIPHRVLYRRMKAENGGKDPSFSDFYFRTHKTKKDKEWVHPKAQDAYENFEKKENELSSQIETNYGEVVAQSQSVPSDLEIWVDTMGGKKKGRVSGLGSLDRSMKTITSGTSLTTTILGDIEKKIRNEVHSFNTSLQAQLEQERQEKEEMKELYETRNTLNILMKKLGYEASSSHSKPISHNQNN